MQPLAECLRQVSPGAENDQARDAPDLVQAHNCPSPVTPVRIREGCSNPSFSKIRIVLHFPCRPSVPGGVCGKISGGVE